MKKRVLLLGLLIVITTVAYPQSVRRMIKAGEQFMEGEKYEAAVEQFAKVIDSNPNDPDGYAARANALEKLGRLEEAYADLEKALVLSPKDVDILYGLGRIANKQEEYASALQHLNRATGLSRRDSRLYPEKVITLMELKRYDQALKVADTALLLKRKDRSMNHYNKGLVYLKLDNDMLAKREFESSIKRDKDNPDPRIAIVDLLIREGDFSEALKQCNAVIERDENSTRAYTARSKVYIAQVDFPSAINDISRCIVMEPDVAQHYYTRGLYYQQFNQHTNAINDFTRFINLKNDDKDVYFARAKSYEEIMDLDKAIADYNRVTEIARFDPDAHMKLEEVSERLFELRRETDAPDITIISPEPSDNALAVRGDSYKMLISGTVKDQSEIEYLTINSEKVPLTGKDGVYEFVKSIDIEGLNTVEIAAADIYDNVTSVNLSINRTETNPPVISIVEPHTSDGGTIFLKTNDVVQRIEGRIRDESLIRSISVDGEAAVYYKTDMNPTFSASVNVQNKRSINVVAEDVYGNRTSTEFMLSRESALLSEDNPMGLTWAVFVENTNYGNFASLEGPVNDIEMMQRALDNYEVHRVIHKKNLSRTDMDRFFSIELRDMVRENNVKSLLIWYAGHGKFINDVGYWIPVDATRDDEFTYYNINNLRAAMEPYTNFLDHLLVVTDACESGPSFYTAMRSTEIPDCGDWTVTSSKSAQVLSSAGRELAADNSQFTETFYNVLMNNPNSCMPIDEIYLRVSEAVSNSGQQEPLFGRITGLRHEEGTFFFIAK